MCAYVNFLGAIKSIPNLFVQLHHMLQNSQKESKGENKKTEISSKEAIILLYTGDIVWIEFFFPLFIGSCFDG